jgi:uncharacterized membrane protein
MDSSAPLVIAALWALFLASHMGLSSQFLRPRLVSAIGLRGFLGAYSVIALAIFVPLVWFYGENKHVGDYYWYGSTVAGLRPVMYGGMVFALTMVVGAFMNASPSSIAPGDGKTRGVLRISRHPLFMGVTLIGLLHLAVARIHTTDLVFFVGLIGVSLIGSWHQDQRHLANGDAAFKEFYEETSFLPFARGGLRGLIEPPWALAIGIGLTVLIRIVHPAVFGGAP